MTDNISQIVIATNCDVNSELNEETKVQISKVPTFTDLCYQCLTRCEGRDFIRICYKSTTPWIPPSIVVTILRKMHGMLSSECLHAAEYLCPEILESIDEIDVEFWKLCFRKEFRLFDFLFPKPFAIEVLKTLSSQISAAREYFDTSTFNASNFQSPRNGVTSMSCIPMITSMQSCKKQVNTPNDDTIGGRNPVNASELMPWLSRVLLDLQKVPMTISILRETRIGEAMNKLAKYLQQHQAHIRAIVPLTQQELVGLAAMISLEIVNNWKKIADAHKVANSTLTTPSVSSAPSTTGTNSTLTSPQTPLSSTATTRTTPSSTPSASVSGTLSNVTPTKACTIQTVLQDDKFQSSYESTTTWRSLHNLLSECLNVRYDHLVGKARQSSQKNQQARSQSILVRTKTSSDKRVRIPVPIIGRLQMQEAKRRKMLQSSLS